MPDVERRPWDRLPTESTKANQSFREFRDMGPLRSLGRMVGTSRRNAEHWSRKYAWVARAGAWDDEERMIEDRERLESLRTMHSNHANAARALQRFALEALGRLDVEEATPGDVVRLLDLGVRLEKSTLVVSVEELQGRPRLGDIDDPWARIAAELTDNLPGL